MRLVIVGYGYSSRAIHAALGDSIDQLIVTCRTQAKANQLKEEGLGAIVFDGTAASADLQQALCKATHLIMSAAPDERGDPLLRHHEIADARCLQWVGYISTVGVYGDHDGAWVDETSQTRPVSKRSIQRVAAEQAWQQRRDVLGISYSAFRLAGIYGRNRSALDKVRSGTARRIIKPGQVFNRMLKFLSRTRTFRLWVDPFTARTSVFRTPRSSRPSGLCSIPPIAKGWLA